MLPLLGLLVSLLATLLGLKLFSKQIKLDRFPGPKLAVWFGRWYAAYFDLIKDGTWVEHLESLHSLYGELQATIFDLTAVLISRCTT